jgi:hypothetical protein
MSRTRDDPKPKIGDGHASAMWRQGLAELRGAFFNESNVAQPPQYGLYGTPVPGEIAEARRIDVRDLNGEQSSVLADRLRQAESRDVHESDSKHLERE